MTTEEAAAAALEAALGQQTAVERSSLPRCSGLQVVGEECTMACTEKWKSIGDCNINFPYVQECIHRWVYTGDESDGTPIFKQCQWVGDHSRDDGAACALVGGAGSIYSEEIKCWPFSYGQPNERDNQPADASAALAGSAGVGCDGCPGPGDSEGTQKGGPIPGEYAAGGPKLWYDRRNDTGEWSEVYGHPKITSWDRDLNATANDIGDSKHEDTRRGIGIQDGDCDSDDDCRPSSLQGGRHSQHGTGSNRDRGGGVNPSDGSLDGRGDLPVTGSFWEQMKCGNNNCRRQLEGAGAGAREADDGDPRGLPQAITIKEVGEWSGHPAAWKKPEQYGGHGYFEDDDDCCYWECELGWYGRPEDPLPETVSNHSSASFSSTHTPIGCQCPEGTEYQKHNSNNYNWRCV